MGVQYLIEKKVRLIPRMCESACPAEGNPLPL